MEQITAPEIIGLELLKHSSHKASCRPPFAGPKNLILTRSKDDVAAFKALGYDAVVPGSDSLPNLDFENGCPPIIVAMGYGWVEEEETRKICNSFGIRAPITPSSFNYRHVYEEKPESLPVHSIIFSESKDVSTHRCKFITCMKKDQFKVSRLWESLNLPADKIFMPAITKVKPTDGGNS